MRLRQARRTIKTSVLQPRWAGLPLRSVVTTRKRPGVTSND